MDILTNRTLRTKWRGLAEQLGTLALSIILGFVVWLIAVNQENPIIQAEFPERIPVTVRGLSGDLQP
ncbi:hypothetical protein RY27_14385, partial [Litorilinea aerophila]